MDKFFAYGSLIGFWSLYALVSVEYWFYDGDLNDYVALTGMSHLFIWFTYKVNLTNVTRHIVHYGEDDEK